MEGAESANGMTGVVFDVQLSTLGTHLLFPTPSLSAKPSMWGKRMEGAESANGMTGVVFGVQLSTLGTNLLLPSQRARAKMGSQWSRKIAGPGWKPPGS